MEDSEPKWVNPNDVQYGPPYNISGKYPDEKLIDRMRDLKAQKIFQILIY